MAGSLFSSRHYRSKRFLVLVIVCLLALGCSFLINASTSASSAVDKAVTGIFVGKAEVGGEDTANHDYYLSFTINQGKALIAVATLTEIYSNKVLVQNHTMKSDLGFVRPSLQNKQAWEVDVKVASDKVYGQFIVHGKGQDKKYNVTATRATGNAGLYWTKTRSENSTYVGGWILLADEREQGGGVLKDGQKSESRPVLRSQQIHSQQASLDENTILLVKKVEPSMIDSVDLSFPARY
ncbi:hypothetical protein [Dictyobacter kobayashii]|uniref:Uncharacterized protein n=1 Tax=Dictyobacter kobayashii TaxID=2014872 RepID=A0A402ALP5_9CHLR|nr:hypothetical protein [Dictyobacter kobayashii]GCE19944.1 hypothetical protein KDK_37440 [Dictyobacter kobayashii]